MRVPSWLASALAACGVLVQLSFAAWVWYDYAPRAGQDTPGGAAAVLVLVGVAWLGLLPATLLMLHPGRQGGRRAAVRLGFLFCLLVFWIPEGILLLAAWYAARNYGVQNPGTASKKTAAAGPS